MTLEKSLITRAVPTELWADLEVIMHAVDAGWFAIPAGPHLTYSKAQHAALSQLSSRAPWLLDLHTEAVNFVAVRASGLPQGKGFGVLSLPDFQADALSARTRLARLPHEHVAGAITLKLWVQVLLDTQAVAQHLSSQMKCLRPAWMWDPCHPLADQVERLKAHDCLHLLLPYVSSTRNRSLDHFERQLLKDVQYRGLPTEEYERRMHAERQRRGEAERTHWLKAYALVRRLAAIFDGVSSYHQGTLTRRLKQESKGAFRLQRSGLAKVGLVVEVRPNFCVGQNAELASGFMLVNYCQALADEVESAAPSFPAYLDACERARARVQDLSYPASNHRPPDDFDTVTE